MIKNCFNNIFSIIKNTIKLIDYYNKIIVKKFPNQVFAGPNTLSTEFLRIVEDGSTGEYQGHSNYCIYNFDYILNFIKVFLI